MVLPNLHVTRGSIAMYVSGACVDVFELRSNVVRRQFTAAWYVVAGIDSPGIDSPPDAARLCFGTNLANNRSSLRSVLPTRSSVQWQRAAQRRGLGYGASIDSQAG